MRWTLAASGASAPDENAAAYGEVVWSWRRDPGVYPLRLCGDGNGDNEGRSPGRARISRKAIARGKPGCPGCTCQTRVRVFCAFLHTALRAQSAPGFPCALCSKRDNELASTRAKTSRGNAAGCLKTESANSPSSLRTQGPITTGWSRLTRCGSSLRKTAPCGYGSPGRTRFARLPGTTASIPAAGFHPGFCQFIVPLRTEGAGKAGRRLRPQHRVQW